MAYMQMWAGRKKLMSPSAGALLAVISGMVCAGLAKDNVYGFMGLSVAIPATVYFTIWLSKRLKNGNSDKLS